MKKCEIKLIDGLFKPNEGFNIIDYLMMRKINFIKVESLNNWNKDHDFDLESINDSVIELKNSNKEVKDFIKKAKNEGKNIKIDCDIRVTIIDKND